MTMMVQVLLLLVTLFVVVFVVVVVVFVLVVVVVVAFVVVVAVHHTDWLQSTYTMLGELKLFISLSTKSWNKLSNILRVFQIVITVMQTLLTYSLLLTLRNIITLSPFL